MADHSDTGRRPAGALFSMEAADNAEVIPEDLPRGPDAMWSTAANPADVEEVPPPAPNHRPPPPSGVWAAVQPQVSDAGPVDDDLAWQQMGSATPPHGARRNGAGFGLGDPTEPLWASAHVAPTPPGAPGAGGVFSAEPVERQDDVIDEAALDGELDDEWTAPVPGASVFSNGAGPGAEPPAPEPAAGPRPAGPFATPTDPWNTWEQAPEPAPPTFAAPSAAPMGDRRDDPAEAVAADQHGLDVAVARLRTEDQERARVPLSVCGALLEPGEQVLGAVTGQMLGRPAAVVVTRSRVLVVNDRRWQPIVDIYPIDDSLTVRGRHDRHVAALSFADAERLSMVDGISEVELAVDLAWAIRDPGLHDRDAGAAF